MIVLDTSALFSMESPPPGDVRVTPGVLRELARYKDPRLRFWDGLLEVAEPSPEAVAAIKRAAAGTGDDRRLSATDVEVLALAYELKAVLWSDDYSVQNLARVAGVECRGVGLKGITEVRKWKYRCVGCRKVWDEDHPDCPICGSALKSVRHWE